MTIELRTPEAIERADAERERVERKVEAFEAFADRVSDVSPDGGRNAGASGAPGAVGPNATGANALAVGTTTGGGTEAVREAFRETVLPHAEADAMQAALADELSPDLAAALSPAVGGFSAGLRDRLRSRAEKRRAECRLLADGIAAERDRLREFADELETVTGWLAEADETPLLQLGFEELRARHDRLAEFRETCDDLAERRQASLGETRRDGLTGIRERELRDHLYADFEADNPVLADLAELDAALAECQRSVRRHLCARV